MSGYIWCECAKFRVEAITCNGCFRSRSEAAPPKPTFLSLMKRPCRSVEKESAEANAKAILEKTCAELRLKNNG